MKYHEPVLVNEVLSALRLQPGEVVVDGTLGGGGHALAMAAKIGPSGTLVGLDRDPEMLAVGEARLRGAFPGGGGPGMTFAARPYEAIAEVLQELGVAGGADAVLLDLGVNSLQLEEAGRGFSFTKDGPLDGRFNRSDGGQTMAELVNNASEKELAGWLRDYADERLARPIARRIAERRASAPITTTAELAALVAAVYPPRARHGRIHPATRAFQALRIAANDEMGAVTRGIEACLGSLNPGGRLAVLTFHSIEDRVCKTLFRALTEPEADPTNPYSATTAANRGFELVHRGALECSEEEAARNPRARSAKLRAIRRLEVAP